ncbi:ABC transporter permease [Salinisphaera sp. USBA-960]|nr:ABC transporter permease [Salifodinibacter halophilus]NNC27115.1 ABC transporter permease [Salifodinibacter halophilus]
MANHAAATVAVFSITSPGIWTLNGIFSMALLGVEIGIIALGQTFVINTGAIDLSVGGMYALSQVAMALLIHTDLPWPLAVAAGILVGTLLGAINGLAVVVFAVPAIIVTLATMFAYQGLALVVTGGVNVSNLPESFLWFGQGTLFDIPVQLLLIYLPLLIVFGWIQHRSRFGRELYLAGTNSLAARLSGIRVDRVYLRVFMIAGGLSAVAGVIDAARLIMHGRTPACRPI